MGQLSYEARAADESTGYVEIDYTAEYDPGKRETTLHFTKGHYDYLGRNGYSTTARTTITVEALDGGGKAQTAEMVYSGTTTGGYSTFNATISPDKVTVQHSGDQKGVRISASTTIQYYLNTSSAQTSVTMTGSGEKEERDYGDVPGSRYRLTVTKGEHTQLTVTREEQSLSDGAELSDGDVLTVTYSADEGWTAACTVSGGSHTVAGNVTVITTATQGGGGSGGKYTLHLKASPNAPITVMREGEVLYDNYTVRVLQRIGASTALWTRPPPSSSWADPPTAASASPGPPERTWAARTPPAGGSSGESCPCRDSPWTARLWPGRLWPTAQRFWRKTKSKR